MKKNTYIYIALVAGSLLSASLHAMEIHSPEVVRQGSATRDNKLYDKYTMQAFESKKFYAKKRSNNPFSTCNDSVCCLLGYSILVGGVMALYQLCSHLL